MMDSSADTSSLRALCAFAVRRLDKRFGATHAVDDVSLTFDSGRVHCLLGENGAGKSTIGKMLGGLFPPDQGDILVDGTPIVLGDMNVARAAGIALVFQELSLAPSLSVRDNICLGVHPKRHALRWRGGRDEDRLCRGVLADLGLDIPLDVLVGALPQAHQQLVEVAKALVSSPRLLVLDEPTAMLGAHDRDRLFGAIRRLRAQGVALVLVTHHIEDVLAIGDDVSILKDGRHVASFSITPELTVGEIGRRLTGRQTVAPLPSQPVSDTLAPLLSIEGLPNSVGGHRHLTIAPGQIVAIYGVVGCGREAIARAIVGLERAPAAIRLRLRDRAFAPTTPMQAARQGVNYMPSGRAANCILPTLNIRENLMLRQLTGSCGLLFAGSDERRRAASQLALYGTRFANQNELITSLSGGNQQKVVLGRCLGAAGTLLVLEDPTAGVDIGAKEEIHALLRRAAKNGLAILLISSDLKETLALSDVVHTMCAGKLVASYRAPLADADDAIVTDIMGGYSYTPPTNAEHREAVDVDA